MSRKSLAHDTAQVFESSISTPKKNFTRLNIFAAAFSICQAWAAIGATFALGLPHGGNATIVYGLILILLVYSAIALSIAELASRYPTAGGQYHWTSILAPKRFKRELSYLCGCINTIGWISLTASVTIIPPQLIVGIIKFYNVEYTIKRWHVFLVYQALNFSSLAYNWLALQQLPWTHDVGFFLSLTSLVVIIVTTLVLAHPKQSNSSIWHTFVNSTGWTSDGVAFLTGLININYGFAGLDGAVHLADDCMNAASAIPFALVSAVFISFITAMGFMVATLYCVRNLDEVIASDTGVPIYEIWRQATRSNAAATVFIILLTLILIFTTIAAQQTSSRLTWAFARDDALIFSPFLKKLDPKFGVPTWALIFNSTWVFLIGCVYLGSSTAFNAIVGPGLILEQLSFAFPAFLLMLQLRSPSFVPTKGWFNLGKAGWVVNGVTVGWAVMEVVFYDLPSEKPVTGGNMNYTVAVLAAIGLFILTNWFLHARKHFQGPTIDLEKFQ